MISFPFLGLLCNNNINLQIGNHIIETPEINVYAFLFIRHVQQKPPHIEHLFRVKL